MLKDELLKCIAETGYNVGFGAKKHFATYDIVEKTPGYISFLSMAFGIYAIAFEQLSTKFLSSSFIILGIVGLYISLYDHKKNDYDKTGVELTQIYNKLAVLYRTVKSSQETDLCQYEADFLGLQNEFYSNCQSKQILFSDCYAHYKFFWQHQIDWIEEQKNFSLLRDKIPFTVSCFVALMFLVIVFLIINTKFILLML
ncbi:SLATT domain-containing protein [Klebsiella aerogenes]